MNRGANGDVRVQRMLTMVCGQGWLVIEKGDE